MSWQEDLINSVSGTGAEFDKAISDIHTILTTDIFSGSMYSTAQSVQTVVAGTATTICAVLFLIEFCRLLIQEDIVHYAWLLKGAVKFCIAKECIQIGGSILHATYNTAINIAGGVANVTSSAGASYDSAFQLFTADKTGIFEALGIYLSCNLFAMVIKGITLIIKCMAYARNFEMLAYIAIAPLPCAFIMSENSRIAKNFFLNFAGVCLAGVFMMLSVALYSAITADLAISADSLSSANMTMCLNAVVLLMAVTKSGQWAQKCLSP